MTYVLACIQAATCVALGFTFLHAGNWRLAVAQCMYAVATIVLFARA